MPREILEDGGKELVEEPVNRFPEIPDKTVIPVETPKEEAEIKKKLEYPLQSGEYVEKTKPCFCILDGKIQEGVILGYAKINMSVPYNEEKDYEFEMSAHKVRLSNGEEIEHSAVFRTREEAEKHLEEMNSGEPTVYKIDRTSPDPFKD